MRYYALLETRSVRVTCSLRGLHFPADVTRVEFRQSLVCRRGRVGTVFCPRCASSTSRNPAYVSGNLSAYRRFRIARNFQKDERLSLPK